MLEEKTHFGHEDYEINQREVIYQGVFRMVRLHLRHRLFAGGWSESFTRELLERFSAAAVLPYDPILDRVILIEQFRPGSLSGTTPWLIEIPAGVLVGNDTPEKLAVREAAEEAGCEVTALLPITEFFTSPGGCDEYLHIYCGRVDAGNIGGIHGLKHEHEDIRVLNVTADEALRMLRANEIKTSPAIVALLWLELNRGKIREKWLK